MATSFDLGGLLGSAFGGDEYGDLLTPAQQSAIQQRALLSAASALLQAGAPSTTRTSLGQALGAALTAGQTGAEKAQQSALTGMLTRQKLEEARRAKDLQDRIGRLLTPTAAAAPSATVTPEMALAAPVTEEMPAGPTVARAAMIGQAAPAAPAMSANEMQAQRYRQAADVYTASGRTEDAKRMMDIAEQLAPTRQEVVGEIFRGAGNKFFQRTKTGGIIEVPAAMAPAPKPVGGRDTVTDLATGNQILVQGYDDGSFQTVQGFGPKRDVVLQNVDGRIVAIDRGAVQAGQTFGTGISPADQARLDIEKQRLEMERRRLGISEAEFARNAYERVETAQGIVYVPKRPGAPIIPIMDAQGKPLMGGGAGKPTEGESNAAGFAQRMERSLGVIAGLPEGSQPGVRAAVAGSIPLIGGVAQRRAMTPEQQQFKQAADDWIRAKLRKESGAVIGEDEMKKEFETYFPQIGDGPEVIAQKAQARAVATNAMRASAGRAYQPYTPPQPQAAQGPKEGDTSKDRNGRNIIFRNGQWVYQ
jgi:hypothetical protein